MAVDPTGEPTGRLFSSPGQRAGRPSRMDTQGGRQTLVKTIKQARRPRPGVFDPTRRDTVLDLTDFAAGRIDPAGFFAENHITEGMKTLLTEGFRRLEGKSTQGVFKLTQAMGGGKTHNLLALGLLARFSLQVVTFTHQDAKVWAHLTLILWAAGLRVTAAWTIATETQSALKEGNYVQGTLLMVLRKQTSEETAFLDEVVPEVETEVERQLRSMLALGDQDEPNFSDADYQFAAYAAALRMLTRYRSLEDLDIARQLARERGTDEPNPIEVIIEDAVRTASNFLVPSGLPPHLWRRLGPEEKLYLRGFEVESRGEFRAGVYQEFARGFGVRDYRPLLRTGKANETRLKTASELKRRDLGESTFGASLVRHALYGVWRAAEAGDVAGSLTWLRTELPAYWPQREALTAILRYVAALESDHWRPDDDDARLLAGAVENDHV